MILTIIIDSGVQAYFDRLAGRVDAASRRGLETVGRHVEAIEQRQIGKIYQRPVPTKAQVAAYKSTGQRPRRVGGSDGPAWNRSGDLQSGVRLDVATNRLATIDIQGRAAGYAQPRHELGVSRMPKNPALGIVRENPFAQEAVEITAPQVGELYADGFRAEMEKARS
jgi:hypothetical protein